MTYDEACTRERFEIAEMSSTDIEMRLISHLNYRVSARYIPSCDADRVAKLQELEGRIDVCLSFMGYETNENRKPE